MMNGSISFLVTNHGDHSPLDWAVVTADHLVHVSPTASADKRVAARRLELAIMDCLVSHHTTVQTMENTKLAEMGDEHVTSHPDPSDYLDNAVDAVVTCASNTVFKDHFSSSEVKSEIRSTLASHFATSMWNAHSWYVDKQTSHGPNAQAFVAYRNAHSVA